MPVSLAVPDAVFHSGPGPGDRHPHSAIQRWKVPPISARCVSRMSLTAELEVLRDIQSISVNLSSRKYSAGRLSVAMRKSPYMAKSRSSLVAS